MPEPVRPLVPGPRPIAPTDRLGATAIVRSEGWRWLQQWLLTQMAHYDRWGSDPQQPDAVRWDALGRRQAYKDLVTTLYHYAGLPNPLAQPGVGVWLPQVAPEPVPMSPEPDEAPSAPVPGVPWRERRTSGPVT